MTPCYRPEKKSGKSCPAPYHARGDTAKTHD